MLTDNERIALSRLNTNDRLLESVIEHIQEDYAKQWLRAEPAHIKQREALYYKCEMLKDLAKLLRDCANSHPND